MRFSLANSPELRPSGAFRPLARIAHPSMIRAGQKVAETARSRLRAKMPHGFLRSFLAEANRVWFEPALGLSGIPIPALFDILARDREEPGDDEGDEKIPS